MRGSIRKRRLKDGSIRYDARWRAGKKSRERTFRRKKDAEAFLDKTVTSVRDGSYLEIQPALMRDVFTTWLTDLDTRVMLGEVKPSTATSYRSAVRVHFIPAFGDYRSDGLSARVMPRWRQGMAEKIEAGEMTPKTFNNLLNLLHSVLAWAREPAQGYLAHDPLIGQKRLTIRRKEAEFLEEREIGALLLAVGDSPEESAVVHVALLAGLRRGEIFGLQWGDLEANGAGGRLRVRRSLYQGTITTPKTANSERIVDVPQRVLNALTRHRVAFPPMDGGFVFRTAKGTPTDPDNWYRRRFTRLRTRAGLRSTIGMHTLRHTYASLLIRQGENIKYVSRQLGHASTSFTMDVYGHLFESTSTEAMRRLDSVIPGPTAPRLQLVGSPEGPASSHTDPTDWAGTAGISGADVDSRHHAST